MKSNVHPQWFPESIATCVCGNVFKLGSTLEKIHVDICDKCHPFYTGEMKYIDSLGRVDKFKKKQSVAKNIQVKLEEKKKKLKQREEERKYEPRTLKEMLQSIR